MLNRSRIVTFLVLLFSHLAWAGGGGPDAFGYTWRDCANSPDHFRWVDIVGRPQATQLLGLADDNYSASIPLGFSFRFYWVDYNALRIGSNGWLTFSATTVNNAHCFQPMPSPTPQGSNATLAPLMSDLNFSSSYTTLPNAGEVWYWTSPGLDSFVVTYLNVPWWKNDQGSLNPPDWIGSNTFQVILSARDSSITYNYLRISQDSMPTYPCLTDVVVGIENSSGLIGLTALADSLPGDSSCFRFIYPGVDSFLVSDMVANWNNVPGSKGFFVLPGDTIPMRSNVANAGNNAFSDSIFVVAKVLSQGQNLRWSSKDSLYGIGAGADTTIDFSHPCILSQPGHFFSTTLVNAVEDINPTNDFQSSEIVVVDTSSVLRVLSYSTTSSTTASVSWPPSISGGNGAGMYFRPPYPIYRVTAVNIFIVGNDGNPQTPLPAGFRVEVFAADSLGQLGQQLSTDLITPQAAIEDGWNIVYPTNLPQFFGEGFYIAWIQGGAGVGLGTETAGPKSRQTYEIINGVWAPYRNLNTEDFLIRVEVEPLLVGRAPAVAREMQLDVHPNPSTGEFTLQWEGQQAGAYVMRVVNLMGEEVLSQNIAVTSAGAHSKDFCLENQSSGVYFLEFSNSKTRVSRSLLLVR
jgi:Secretion system C-terminal sorting domain